VSFSQLTKERLYQTMNDSEKHNGTDPEMIIKIFGVYEE
jgi:hypothetical protein